MKIDSASLVGSDMNLRLPSSEGSLPVSAPGMLSVHEGSIFTRFTENWNSLPSSFLTGPGPDTLLAGNKEAGYYGTFNTELLFDVSELSSLTDFQKGTYVSGIYTSGWLKFSYKGKILFISKGLMRRSWDGNNISKSYIDDRNLRTGGSSAPVVEKDGFSYVVRMISAEEWSDLIYPVHIDDPSDRNWDSFTNRELDIGNDSPTSLSNSVNNNALHVRGDPTLTSTSAHIYCSWRPVLELVQ